MYKHSDEIKETIFINVTLLFCYITMLHNIANEYALIIEKRCNCGFWRALQLNE